VRIICAALEGFVLLFLCKLGTRNTVLYELTLALAAHTLMPCKLVIFIMAVINEIANYVGGREEEAFEV
jgi:hypothetical protein